MERVILHGGDGTTGMPWGYQTSSSYYPPLGRGHTFSLGCILLVVPSSGGGDRVPAVLWKRPVGSGTWKFGCVELGRLGWLFCCWVIAPEAAVFVLIGVVQTICFSFFLSKDEDFLRGSKFKYSYLIQV